MLTIFTPTYNRAHTLLRLYESLKFQTFNDFEWIIIDDGSEDDTEIIVNRLIKDSNFFINYIKQENSGKQAAWNKALDHAQGTFFCCVDSDDCIYNKQSFDWIFQNYIHFLNGNDVIGLRFLAFSNVKNDFHGSKLSDETIICSWFKDFSDPKNYGERIDVFKTDILKIFKYPVEQDVKFVPEIWLYVELSKFGYKFAYAPYPLRLFYDDVEDNRLSRSSIKKHALGHYIARSNMLKSIPNWVFFRNYIAWIKTLIRYSQCANYLRISFNNRRVDTNFFYAVVSYLLYFTIKGLD